MNLKIIFIGIFLSISYLTIAQEDTTDYYEEDYYNENYEYPKNFFFRIGLSDLLIDANPAEISYTFWDDDYILTDSISNVINTDNLWSYGLSTGLSFLIEPDWMINYDAHFGLGSGGKMFTFTNQLGLGKEFKFKSFYLQPMFSLGYIGSNINLGSFFSENKTYFEVNGRFFVGNLTARFKSRAFTIHPALFAEYALNRDLSIFGKVGIHYSYWDNHFFTVGGDTDEFNSDGEAISAVERISFNDLYRLNFYINHQIILDKNSPYIHYNLNAVQIQIGLSYSFSSGEMIDSMYDY